jgi:hypothetical protein
VPYSVHALVVVPSLFFFVSLGNCRVELALKSVYLRMEALDQRLSAVTKYFLRKITDNQKEFFGRL